MFLRPFRALAVSGLALALSALGEGFIQPAPLAPGVAEGEVLLGELNCLACHSAAPDVARRIDSRGAPRLGPDGLRLTATWLREWLANPHVSKPGSAMPDALNGLSDAQRAAAAEALTQYLVAQQPQRVPDGVSADPARAEKGRVLFHALGCVACHAPTERSGDASDADVARLQAASVPLGNLARKYPAGELVRFLLDPVKHRPGGRMPSLALTANEATDLAVFLLRDQLKAAGSTAAAAVAGLKWDYFEGDFHNCADLQKQTPVASGVTEALTDKLAKRETNYGLKFSGVIDVPADGEYTFWTTSDDGSQIWVDGKLVVNNDGEHGADTKSGKITLTKGTPTFELLFFQAGSGAELKAEWRPPGSKRGPIPATALRHFARPLVPVGLVQFTADPAKIAEGRDWYTKLNCGACHQGTDAPVGKPAAPLLALAGKANAGCLADAVPAGAPKFDLTADQRTALRQTVAAAAQLAQSLTPALQVATTMTRLNCYACHQRDDVGGPATGGRADWFKVVGEADLGDEGRIPPRLTGVGNKLRPEWLGKVLNQGAKVRPYMATRMPQFGATNANALQPALLAADARVGALPEPALTERDAKFGWKLVGAGGLGCIACHTFGQLGSTGIPALGLDTMHERLQWDWFRRYLPDPAALRPGTRMPTFWPEGHAVNRDLLAGDTDAQIRALWAYLAAGKQAEVPAGLVRGKKEIVVDKEAVIYRNFIEGAGARAVGVGYPEKANLAFDAETGRLALVWQGSFIDAARHSTDRGVGFEPPLGDHRVQLPEGAPFAVLASPESPWPVATGKAGGYRFHGYQLDAARRPAFRYAFHGVEVDDFILPRPGDVDMTLVRAFKLSGSAPGTVWFRAAIGSVKPGPDGTFIVNDTLRMTFRGAGEPRVVGQELRVPVKVPGEFTVEMTW